MSTFQIRAYPLTIEPHPGADRLELAVVGAYRSVVAKDQFKTGDIAIYIQEASIVPEVLLHEMNLWDDEKAKGRLAGSKGDRVKAIRLRKVISQGICVRPIALGDLDARYAADPEHDYAEELGLVKYVPAIPTQLAGKVEHVLGLRTYTDMENIKRFPGILQEGEQVWITEKLHGTCSVLSLLRDGDDWNFAVSSKGQAGRGLGLVREVNPEGKAFNAYWLMAEKINAETVLRDLAQRLGARDEITLFGETVGVQDLMYGLQKGELSFAAFDLRVDGEYMSYNGENGFYSLMAQSSVPTVTILFQGAFSQDAVDALTDGPTLTAGANHIREGVVIRPVEERRDDSVGRVLLKSISAKYLLRKGEVSEYE